MINLTVVIDNDEAIRKLRELQKTAQQTTSSVVTDAERMDASWHKMKNTLAGLAAGVSFSVLAKQVVQIRGEVQQLEVAFETMLGSKAKAEKLMSEAIELAAKTPFGLQDVSNATKMLLAYGSSAEEVTNEIKMLGNIASGLSIPLNDMIYLYGTTRTQGRMFTQDLRQFMGRGIPLAEELAKQFGVTKDKVGELVTAGKVGFDDMAKALQAMTSEGGQFNDLMEKQSQTIAGQISNLEDAIYQMFNEIGKSSEGVISDLISGAAWVVEHYQEVLSVLKYVIAAYGSYKAALIAVAAIDHVITMAKMATTLIDVAKGAQTAASAFALLQGAKKGWIGLAAGVISAIAIATYDLSNASEDAAKQMGELEKAARDEYVEVNRLVATLQQSNTSEQERNDILARLKEINPAIVKGISDEADITAILTSNLKAYNEEQVRKIQLSAIGDKQQAAITDKANAGLVFGEAEAAAKEAIKQIQASLNMGELSFDTKTTNSNFSKKSKAERAKIQELITEEISQILQSNLSDIDKVKAINNIEVMTNPSNAGGYRKTGVRDISGVNLSTLIENWEDADKAFQAADQALIKLTNDNEQLAEILGLSGKEVEDNTESVKTYAEAYADAQKAYIDTQKELAKANKDRKAGTSTISEKEYKDIVDRAEAAKKAYQELGGVTSAKAQAKAEKQNKEAAKLAKELQYDVDQAVIDSMAEGTDKKIAQIKLDTRKRIDAIEQQESELKEKQGGKITIEQQGNIDALYGNAQKLEKKQIADVYKEEFAKMQEFLKEYGTYQQRKLAIATEYAEKIKKAETPQEAERLTIKRDKTLASLSAQELNATIDWEAVFGDFGNMFAEYLKPEFEALSEYIKTDEFINADPADKETVLNAYNNLKEIFGGKEKVSFSSLGASISRLQQAQANLSSKQEIYASAYQVLIDAQKNYAEALASGEDAAIKNAKAFLEVAEMLESNAAKNVEDATTEYNDARAKTGETASQLQKAMDDTAEGLRQVASANISTLIPALKSTAEGLAKFGGNFGTTLGNIASKLGGTIGSIIDFILQIIDILKDGISGLVVPIIDAIFNAISGVIGDILNFKDGLFRQLGESLYKGILGIFKSILTLGGWFDWIGDGESDPTLEADLERLSEVNTALTSAIDRLNDTIANNTERYERQKALMEEIIANSEEAFRRSAASSSNGFLGVGGEKSTATKITNGMSQKDWDRINALFGTNMSSGWDLLNLSAKEMYDISTLLPDIWGKIIALADDGHEDASGYLTEMVGYYQQLLELEEQHKENVTGISYEEFSNKFKAILTDMEMSSEEFADDFNKMLIESIASALIANKYADKLNALRDHWHNAMEDGQLTDEEKAALEAERDEIVKGLEDDRAMIREMFGGTIGSQTATTKGFQAMSQDTGDELSGRFTAIQGNTYEIADEVKFIKEIGLRQETHLSSISDTMAMIHNDTSLIEIHTRRLEGIEESLMRIRQKVETI